MEGTNEVLDGKNYWLRGDAINECYMVARARGYKCFSLQDNGSCMGSKTACEAYAKSGPSTACLATGRGEKEAVQVYKITE